MSRWAAIGLLVLTACAATESEVGSRRPHSVKLFNFAKQPRLSYLLLRMGAAEGWFLVDTGASRHVLSSQFYRKAFPGRPLGPAKGKALSWAGQAQPLSEARDLPATWSDGVTDRLDFAVADFLPAESHSSMVGIISPQRLGSAVELDFIAGELRWPFTEEQGVVYSQAERTLYLCGPRGATVFGWSTAIDGVPMWGLLDTGAVLTGLSLSHPLAQRLLPPNGGGNAVAMDDASRTPMISVQAPASGDFGGRQWHGQIILMQMEHSPCDFPAVIGMDVLSRCRITLSGNQASARCGS